MTHMNARDAWTTWLEAHVGAQASGRKIADLIGRDNKTVSRWLKERPVRPDLVVPLARALDVDLLDALVAAGQITKEQAARQRTRGALSMASDLELAEELFSRASRGTATADIMGDDELYQREDNVHHLRPRLSVDEGSLRAASDADIDNHIEGQQEEP